MKLIAPHQSLRRRWFSSSGRLRTIQSTTSVLVPIVFVPKLFPIARSSASLLFALGKTPRNFASLSRRHVGGSLASRCVHRLSKDNTTPKRSLRGHLRRSPEGGKERHDGGVQTPFFGMPKNLESSRRRRQKNVDAFISEHQQRTVGVFVKFSQLHNFSIENHVSKKERKKMCVGRT